jgi:hypothetical protein
MLPRPDNGVGSATRAPAPRWPRGPALVRDWRYAADWFSVHLLDA